MALSSTELTTIVNQVLSALRTNAKTISDLTPVTELLDTDFFEVAGGKKVSYGVLKTLIAGLSASEQSLLLTSVNKKELSKVELTLSATSAVLKISSKEKDITCTIPVATDSKGGFMSATDKVKLDAAYNATNSGVLKKFSHLEDSPDQTRVVFDSSTGNSDFVLKSATTEKSGLMSAADKNKLEEASSKASEAKSLLDNKGLPNGIATLDASGRIPSSQLPGYVDDVIEFKSIVSDITVQLASSLHASTDLGCDVVYDTTSNRFVLAAPSADGVISYYANWVDGETFGKNDAYGKIPQSGKIYTCISDNKTFRWSGSTLVAIGSDLALGFTEGTAYPGDKGRELAESVNQIDEEVYQLSLDVENIEDKIKEGVSHVGNEVNVTVEFPTSDPNRVFYHMTDSEDEYYAPMVVYKNNKMAFGRNITFEIAKGSWQTYKYIGNKLDQDSVKDINNWRNVASMSAGEEEIININEMCGNPVGSAYYVLNSALDALTLFEKNSGISYRKGGMVITYRTGVSEWETKQLNGSVDDFTNKNAWKDFGGGSAGNEINIHEITGEWGATNRGAAAALVPDELRVGGCKITFMYAAGKWQTWQFTGALVSDWSNESYWRQEIRSVSINQGEAVTPDAEGNVDLSFNVPIDQQLNPESERAVSNKAVSGRITEVEDSMPNKFGWNESSRQLSLMDQSGNVLDSVTISGGGGGSTVNPTGIEISIQSSLIATVREGEDYVIEYFWHHYNINTNVDTQYGGTAELIVGGAVVERKSVTQGYDSFNVGPWLQAGLNNIRIRITADDGLVQQSANVKITAASLSLRSLYDISTVNIIGSPITMRYIVNGSGDKKVNFSLDGDDIGTETVTTSGSTSIKTVSTNGMYHSVKTVTMEATRDIGTDKPLRTDAISFDVMVINRESYKPLIAISRTVSAKQYSTVQIPFAVYDPCNSLGAVVEIYCDGELVQSQLVDRTLHTFSYRVKKYGEMTFTFKVSNDKLTTENSVTVNVIQAETQIEAETDALALYLSASGRSNDAENRADWKFTSESGITTSAQFSGVGFDTQSGWKVDSSGITALHLEKGSTCYIPFTPFSSDAKLQGKTIEIEFSVSNCFDTSATLISCLQGNVGFEIKAQEAYISSALKQTVGTKFKQDERLRVGFVVEQVAGTNRFMHLFINGKHSGVVQYDTNDYFVQNPSVGITLGHPSCELNVYNIRVYENALSFRQMLNNYIADMDDTNVMFAKLAANDILNEESAAGEIDFSKAVKKIACLRYIGELPKFKGDKKTGLLVYEDPFHPEDNFSVVVQIDVQGTSSQYYVVKNWKVKAKDLFQMSTSGTTAKKFALRAYDANGNEIPQKPVKTFCLKADFAESSGTHNTGAANMIDEILKASGIKTPMQEIDNTVRTTVFGFPVLLFHQESQSSPIRFVGKYNFNNDKSTHDTFGFQDIEGFNKGMINRDDYLVWEGDLASLQNSIDAVSIAEDAEATYYLIGQGLMKNHLVQYDESSAAWVDKGEMWRWDANSRCWKLNDGTSCTRAQGILDKVAGGALVENNVECWEFLNNGHKMCLFHESDYTSQKREGFGDWVKDEWMKSDDNGKYAPYWTGAFEPRYPDNDDNNRQYARGRIPEQLKRVTDWLASLNGIVDDSLTEAEKNVKALLFAGQIDNYFNKRMTLAYDIIRQGFVAADQGAKNMMWAIIDGIIYIIFYDNDTIWLINNEGRIMFIPYVEPHSKDSLGKFVFNGESSVLWNCIERGLQSEQRALYNEMVAAGFTYERALFWFNKRQSDQWCEAVYNADSKYKYIDSFGKESEDGTGATNNYLDMAQGSREEHRKWAMSERFQYQNAKFGAGSFRESRIYLRVNTAGESSVPSRVEVDVTAAQDWYFAFRFAANSGWNPIYVKAGETRTFSAPDGSNPNDTETYIHQADRISDIGDISHLYPTTCEVAQGRMLRRLIVGNKTEGYIGKLATLTLGTHPLMTELNVCNIPTLTSSLDLTGCSAIEKIEAQGSRITGVNLPAGSGIKYLHLPETVVQLEFSRLPNLTNSNLQIDGYANVQTVNITDCTYLNPMLVLDAITATPGNKLQYIRVTGGNLSGTGAELLRLIHMGVHGVNDRNGLPEVLGTYHMIKIPTAEDLATIIGGINPDGFTVEIVVEAFTNEMDDICNEIYSGDAEVEEVTIDNVHEHIRFFNGETYDEWNERIEQEEYNLHEFITK